MGLLHALESILGILAYFWGSRGLRLWSVSGEGVTSRREMTGFGNNKSLRKFSRSSRSRCLCALGDVTPTEILLESSGRLSRISGVAFCCSLLLEDLMKIATLLLAVTILVAPTTLFSNPPQKDVPAEVTAAQNALKGAYNDLQHAGGDWGGHRVSAMQHIQEALTELNEAEKWAREHHDIK